jgi:vancomycin resistance protein YoaR
VTGIPQAKTPTRLSSALFLGKATLLQVKRATQDFSKSIVRHSQSSDESFSKTLTASVTQLWTDTNVSEEWYQRGKIQNLRQAASRLDLCVIPAEQVFSFWRQVGRASRRKGYVPGRMLQEGCMIPAIGGGLCQLSNSIYQVALESGCEILERHPHSRVVPGSATAGGRDATVAWNYIDLRFRPSTAMQLRVMLTATDLRVSLHSTSGA